MTKIILIILLLTTIIFTVTVDLKANNTVSYSALFPIIIDNYPVPPDNKLGVAFTTPNKYIDNLFETFGPLKFFDWGFNHEERFEYPGYFPTIWGINFHKHIPGCGWCPTNIYEQEEEIKRLANKYPNKTWLIFNEPSLSGQADILPFVAAHIAPIIVEWLGPKNKWACCGVAMLPQWFIDQNPGQGLVWMDSYIANGGPIPDYWHIHVYLATTPAEYDALMNKWWYWWKLNGQGRPVIISETAGACHPTNGDEICLEQHKIIMTHLTTNILPDPRIDTILWWKSHSESKNYNHKTWLAEHNNGQYIVTELGQHFLQLQPNN